MSSIVVTKACTRRGLTLIEVMLVIALLGVLVSLALPSLRGSRDRARSAQALASLRDHLQVFAAYAANSADAWPAFTDPRASSTILRADCLPAPVSVPYFGASWSWNVALAKEYYSGDCLSDSFASPFAPEARGSRYPSYKYACSMIADPKFWNPATRTGPQQLRGTRQDETAWPASKVALTDFDRLKRFLPPDSPPSREAELRTGFGFADGSAAELTLGALGPAYQTGESIVPGSPWPVGIHTTDFPPGAHTIDGVRGRDR